MDAELVAKLDADLDADRIHTSPHIYGSYLEGWDVFATANSLFGYDGWAHDIVDMTVRDNGFTYARVRLRVYLPDGETTFEIVHEDTGVGIPAIEQDADGPTMSAMETAIKGAVTDGLKRCFRYFGKQFGNDLYDKDRGHTPPPVARPQSPSPAPVKLGLADTARAAGAQDAPPPSDKDYGDSDQYTPVTGNQDAEARNKWGYDVAPEAKCGVHGYEWIGEQPRVAGGGANKGIEVWRCKWKHGTAPNVSYCPFEIPVGEQGLLREGLAR